ncbi:MAG: RNA polymerase sigma factor [bacterium]
MHLNNNQSISDQDLLNECLEGEQWAWEAFYERFSDLISYAMKKTLQRFGVYLKEEDLEECRQYIWFSFLNKDCYALRKWEKKSSLATWIRVCGSMSTTYFIKSRKKLYQECPIEDMPSMDRLDIDPPYGTHNETEDIPDMLEKKEIIKKAMDIIENKLSDRERLFANLYWFDDSPYEEISKILNMSMENLYLLRHRIVKKIERYLNRDS